MLYKVHFAGSSLLARNGYIADADLGKEKQHFGYASQTTTLSQIGIPGSDEVRTS